MTTMLAEEEPYEATPRTSARSRLAISIKALGCVTTILGALAVGGAVAGGLGLAIVGPLLLLGIPVAGFTYAQMKLTLQGGALARSIEEVQALKAGEAEVLWKLLGRPPAPTLAAPAPAAEPAGRAVAEGFWAALTEAERADVFAHATRETFPAGAVLCREGRPAGHVMVILSGWTKVCVHRHGGERLLALRGPGQLIGERAALRRSSRSATVLARDTVHALVLNTEDFAAVLGRHPRLLAVVEAQLYDRLTEDGAELGAAPRPAWTGQICSILYTDIAEFSAPTRTDADRLAVKAAMYRILHRAHEGAGVPWAACHTEDRGDGALVVVPPDVPVASVVGPLFERIATGLGRYNRGAVGDAVRLRLRVAVHAGPVTSDPHGGVNGEAIIHTARMLNASVLKQRLAETSADLGFITSTFVYDSVIRHRAQADEYRRVRFTTKETRAAAWISLLAP